MKNLSKSSNVLLLTLVCLLSMNLAKSQQTLTQINGWNAYVHLPTNYNNTTTSYPTIIFFPGLGEIGTNASAVIANGPGAYITQGWDGNVVVNGSTVEFIIISLQPSAAYPNEISINQKIQTIKSLYRVNSNKLYLTGLSHGGWCNTTFVTGDPLGGPYTYASQIAAVVEVQGVVPDDNSPYPGLFDNYANAGGRLLGFEQAYDNRGMPTRVNRMNATKPGSAIYVQTNFGNGGHCCWNQFYGGQGLQPGVFMLDGVNQNLYQWLAKQSLGTPVNQAPIANAGADKIITLPTNSTTLNGSGTDADGTITSYQWTKISGPSAGIIANANAALANVSGLTQGVYQYQLKVTDNSGNTNTDLMQVTVNALANSSPTANAGPDQTITLPTNTISLSGSGTDPDGTVASYLWTKLAGPSSGTISNINSAITSVSGLLQGSYSFQLKITDNAGTTAIDNIDVTVNAATVTNNVCNSNTPVTHLLSQTAPGEIYRPNGSLWKGGDTIKITGTNYSVIEFNNVGGDACRPLVIMPMTTLVTPVFRFKGNCRYIKLWGGTTPYGIKINAGPLAISSSHHIEADNIEISGGSIGVYCKQDVVYADTMTWYPNYRMTKFTFKNLWIHDINGEGMYVGITQPSGLTVTSTFSGSDTLILPIRLDSVEISNCIVERTTWDGIQLSNARNGNKIFGNTVRNYGTINMSSQQAGIILGGNTNADIFNNSIIKGTGNGIEAFGYGIINIYGNTLDSCGYDGLTNPNGTQGQHSIYASDYITAVEVNPKQTINIYGNTINHPKTAGAIFVGGYNNNSLPSSIYNNSLCITNADANWLTTYIKTYVTGSTVTNNILSCSGITNSAPTANAGVNITLTLPANSTTVSGSGIDMDGTISGYQWKKISGPNQGTIVSAANATTTINNLVEGIYDFEFLVTDNNAATSKDTLQITVNAAIGTLLPAVFPANTVNGIDYQYYEGNWNALPAFASLTPVKTGFTNNFNLSPANKTTQFGFSFTGYIDVPADGQYKFYTSSDDGSNLYIDNVLTVANDGLHGTIEKSGMIGLKAGKHAIKGLFFQQGGGMVFIVSYEGMGITKQAIPAASLYRVNAMPVSNAGANKILTLPTNSTNLSGLGTDTDGTIASYSWVKIAGPSTGTLTNAATANTTAASLVQGVYSYQLTVTDNAGGIGRDTVNVTVNSAINQLPTAAAGNNQTIFLPNNIAALSGTGTDTDGSIISYQWTKISGTGGSITNALAAATTVTGLTQGTYSFKLQVTDNQGATAADTIQLTLAAASVRIVRVNIFAGINPSTDLKWNNWNIVANANSSNFLYEDKTSSTINAQLGGDIMVSDNGNNYASSSTLPPANVLRYNSYSTSQRTINIKGLNPSKYYTFEFYASRANTGHKTVFMIYDRKDTINTDNNVNDYAKFLNTMPDNSGNISINVSRIGVYNYLAGFSIIEQDDVLAASAVAASTPNKQAYQGENIVEMGADAISVYPNPFAGSFKVQLNNKIAGAFVLKLSATSGQNVFYKKINKASGTVVETIHVNNLNPGTYILEIISVDTGNKTVHKVIKN